MTASGRVLSVTPGLTALLARTGLIAVIDGTLRVRDTRIDDILHTALHCDPEHGGDPACETEIAVAGDNSTMRIVATRLDAPKSEDAAPDPMLLVMFVARPSRSPYPAAFTACGLTQCEQEVALGYGRGLSVREISVERERSVETIRTHLKTAMSKLGLHRQVDLTLLVAASDAER